MPDAIADTSAPGIARTLVRVHEITTALRPAEPAPAAPGFGERLSAALGGPGPGAPGAPGAALPAGPAWPAGAAAAVGGAAGAGGAGPTGRRIAAIATAELGVSERPPGSNDAPRIAEYRTATAGSAVAPWCAYFTSWVGARAGVPVGPEGRGLGYVPTVRSWAEDTGRYIPAGEGAPAVGDLVVFDRGGDGVLDHIGVVTGVSPDGGIRTVEGNSGDAVSARSYGPDGYAGLVRLAPLGA